ncbi:helix-turn-helix transcriptional regulator [Nocardia thailandica]|uniref:Helix-turn-helix transcriptional regulator n=1 Tax=Nocardia thailandica TaxID=257275 RepID=A0ABW6PY24_9NOCA
MDKVIGRAYIPGVPPASVPVPRIDLDRDQVLSVPGFDDTITVTPDVEYDAAFEGDPPDLVRGTLMMLTGHGRSANPKVAETTATSFGHLSGGEMNHFASIGGFSDHIVAVEGVFDPAATYNVLVDTLRAERVYNRLIRERRERAATLLHKARGPYADLDASAKWRARSSGRGPYKNLLLVAMRVGLWHGVDLALVSAESGLDEEEMALVQQWMEEDGTFTPIFLDVNAVAERINVDPATVRSYLNRGRIPPPAPVTLDKPVWEWRVIERWNRSRRGQGWAGEPMARAWAPT